MRKRVLIVNCHFDGARRPRRRPTTVLRSAGPAFLAGAFAPEVCDVRLHDEASCGPLEDERLLAWPDMLVLTGLTHAFDRMLHVTAYARTKSPGVIVVAGGSAIRALPRHAARFFDFACRGDVEELRSVVAEAFGRAHVAEEMLPRFDLAHWMGRVGMLEASRNCNYRCTFCTVAAEGGRYRAYNLDYVRRQVRALGRRRFVVFIDNNFFGNDAAAFRARLELADEMRDEGWFEGWGALVTSDFFLDEDNLRRARESGCRALYCGIESFDRETLLGYRKRQNTVLDPLELIARCLESGVLLAYGLILDPARRRLDDLRGEIDAILARPAAPLPSPLSLAVPYPGTPFFGECVAARRFLPGTRLRDLDGTTLCLAPLDPLEEVAGFVRDLQTLRGRRVRALRHAASFAWRHRAHLDRRQRAVSLARSASAIGLLEPLGRARDALRGRRTHVSTTERLDSAYRPAFPVAARFESHFEPTYLTDPRGEISQALADDVFAASSVVAARPLGKLLRGSHAPPAARRPGGEDELAAFAAP